MNTDCALALYRVWNGKTLLYVGISNSWPRRMGEHQADKPWFAVASRIDLDWYPDRDAVLAAEKRAILAERPAFNIQHNRGAVEIEMNARARVPADPAAIAVMLAGACGTLLLLRWAADAGAAWWMRRRAASEGTELAVPEPRNPFTEEPAPVLRTLMLAFLGAAVMARHLTPAVGGDDGIGWCLPTVTANLPA